MEASMNIAPGEFQTRADRLLDRLRAQSLTGVVLFNNHYILYYTGFAFIPTERHRLSDEQSRRKGPLCAVTRGRTRSNQRSR
jgi:hypothetical protein